MSFSHRTCSALEALESRIAPALIYGVDFTNQLHSFDSAKPGTILTSAPVTGLSSNAESIVAIDFRPGTGELFAVTKSADSAGRLYQVDLDGTATPIGNAPFEISLGDAGFFDIDFNPVTDELRLVSESGLNMRIDPQTGAVIDGDPVAAGVQPDGALNFPEGEITEGFEPRAVGIGYFNSHPGATTTGVRVIDADGFDLFDLPAENTGTLTSLGQFTTFRGELAGFDLLPGNFEGFTTSYSGTTSKLIRLDFATGKSRVMGAIGIASQDGLSSIAALPTGLGIVGNTATFRDVDGDLVTVKVSRGTLTQADFALSAPNYLGGVQLLELDLGGAGTDHAGAAVSITTKAGGSLAGGNGFVNVGRIWADGIDLASLTVKGDLGSLILGDGNLATPAAKTLSLTSHGAVGTASQGGSGQLLLDITGGITAASLGNVIADVVISGAVKTLNVKSLIGPDGAPADHLYFSVGGITTAATVGSIYKTDLIFGGNVKAFTSTNLLYSNLAVDGTVGSLSFKENVTVSSVVVQGRLNPQTTAEAQALKALKIGGDVVATNFLIGYNSGFVPVNGTVQVGAVTVSGNWSFSSISAGISAGLDLNLGTEDDAAIDTSGAISSRIASIVIQGQVAGGPTAFQSNTIGSMKAGGVRVPLTSGAQAEPDFYLLNPAYPSGSVVVREFLPV